MIVCPDCQNDDPRELYKLVWQNLNHSDDDVEPNADELSEKVIHESGIRSGDTSVFVYLCGVCDSVFDKRYISPL